MFKQKGLRLSINKKLSGNISKLHHPLAWVRYSKNFPATNHMVVAKGQATIQDLHGVPVAASTEDLYAAFLLLRRCCQRFGY